MKNILLRKLFLIIILFLVFTINLFAQTTKYVIIVVIDGARYTETFGDATHQYIPRIWNELRPKGTIYTSFYNNGVTITNPGHSTILSGTWQNIANDGSERPHSPTIFEYSRKQLNTTQSDNYVVLGKDKLNILAYSDHPSYGSQYGASVKTSTSMYDDAVTLQNIKSVMSTDHPHLMISNFGATDNGGHSGVYTNYTNSLTIADGLVTDLWNYIQADPVYKNKTTLIITNDHGRHTTDFTSHGDNCEGCRHIMMIILGPDTKAGVVDNSSCQQIDIAPTVASLMHFTTPLSIGNIIPSANSTPTANAGTAKSVCSNVAFTLGGSPTGSQGTAPLTYNWASNTTGFSSSAANPTTTTSATTTYSVTVTESGGLSASSSVIISVYSSPSAKAQFSGGSSCNKINLTSNSSGGSTPLTYSWTSNPIGYSSTLSGQTDLPMTTTTTYTVIVNDANNCKDTSSVTATKSTSFSINMSASSSSLCIGTSTQLNASPSTGSGTFNYMWSSGITPNNISNPSVTPTTNKTYTVTVTDNNACSASNSINITVFPKPASWSYVGSGSREICSGSNTNITITPPTRGTTPFNYNWSSNPSGFSSTSTTFTVSPTITTTYFVTITDANNCANTGQRRITVNKAR